MLLPFLIPIFLVGYVLYVFGEPRVDAVKVPKRQAQPVKAELEIGLLEEVADPQVAC